MKTKSVTSLVVLTASILMVAGCATSVDNPATPDEAKYSIEDAEKFTALDQATRMTVQCTGLQERINAQGYLEVVANLRNLSTPKIRIQANCVFKDAKGFSVGDETPFQKIEIGANATESIRFVAKNQEAKRFTVRVRQDR
jgi:uncharacterized protein YcfL|uniref:DUF1425 domain-containing protein n=1 Tax=Cephaloticoccus sp. TaxID=1985742 RepID=UPI00404A5626